MRKLPIQLYIQSSPDTPTYSDEVVEEVNSECGLLLDVGQRGAQPLQRADLEPVGRAQLSVLLYYMRDEKEGRKKEASKVKQTTRQSNAAHPRQSFFLRKMSCLGWDSNP